MKQATRSRRQGTQTPVAYRQRLNDFNEKAVVTLIFKDGARGVARRGHRGHAPDRRLGGFFYRK